MVVHIGALALPGTPLGDQPAGRIHPHRLARAGAPHPHRFPGTNRRHLPRPDGRLFGLAQRHRNHGVLGGRGASNRWTPTSPIGWRVTDIAALRGYAGHTNWRRLSPRMLLVHPVHEMLRQLRYSSGPWRWGRQPSLAAGGARRDGRIRRAALVFTTYRIDDENVSLRTGILEAGAPVVSAQPDSLGADRGAAVAPAVGVDGAAGGHRPEEPAVRPPSNWTRAVDSARVSRLRALLLAESLAPVNRPVRCWPGGSRRGCGMRR